MTPHRLPAPVMWPGAAAEALAFGRRLVPRSSKLRLPFPGAFVWGGMDHALVRSRWLPMHSAWARGEEPMAPLSEVACWAPVPGLDDSGPARWAPLA